MYDACVLYDAFDNKLLEFILHFTSFYHQKILKKYTITNLFPIQIAITKATDVTKFLEVTCTIKPVFPIKLVYMTIFRKVYQYKKLILFQFSPNQKLTGYGI